jgi:L-threonylcarbamoyladenylate synthase
MAAIEPYTASDLPRLSQTIGRILRHGGLVAVPTETYYGLATNPFDAQAVDRLLHVKGRADGKPVLVLIGHRTQLPLLAREVSPAATVLMDAFWPGPLTILFAAQPSLPGNLTAGTGTVGVRLTSCGPLADLLVIVGPVTGTSANRAGAAPAQTAGQVQETLGAELDAIVDAGWTPGGLPSTVIDARDTVRVLRDGAISRQMLQNVLDTHGIALA